MDPRVMKVLALVWPEGISLSDYDLMLPMVQLVSTALRRSDRTKKSLDELSQKVQTQLREGTSEVMTSTEVADLLGVKRESVAHIAKRQGLTVAVKGKGQTPALFKRADVLEFKEKRDAKRKK